jgi:DNA-binding NarL/FixJ family response regulator
VKWLEESSVEVVRPSATLDELEHVTVALISGASSQQAAAIVASAVLRNRPPIIIVVSEALAQAVRRIREGSAAHQYAADKLPLLRWAHVFNRLMRGLLFSGSPKMERDERPIIAHAQLAALTSRERQVLRFIVAGADNLKIAAHLGIRERTVKAHVSNLFRKFGCENRVQLAMRASQLGIQPAIEV